MSEPTEPLSFAETPANPASAVPMLSYASPAQLPKKPRVWPSYVFPFALLASYFAIGIFIGIVLYLYAGTITSSPVEQREAFQEIIRKPSVLFWLQVGTLGIEALAIAICLYFSKTPRRQRINLRSPKVSLLTLVIFALGSLTLSSFYALIQYHLQYRSHSLETLSHIIENPSIVQSIAAAFLISVVGPILEELIFRGYIQTRLIQRHGPILGILITSFFFGFIHFDLAQGTFAFIFGLFLGLIAWKTRSIIPAILCHIALNSFSTFLTLFQINLHPYEVPRLIACCIILPATLTLIFLTKPAAAAPIPA